MDPKEILEKLALRTGGRLAKEHKPRYLKIGGPYDTVDGKPGPAQGYLVVSVPYPQTDEVLKAWLADSPDGPSPSAPILPPPPPPVPEDNRPSPPAGSAVENPPEADGDYPELPDAAIVEAPLGGAYLARPDASFPPARSIGDLARE